ncbi:MAG TPA: TIGR02594 family protein [Bradyrhizobium sp.]|nr:TIGR02594 family protein [Bradyrhizobium sp.]
MVQLYAFRRSLHFVSLHGAALALCSAAIVASATPASARSLHGAGRHAHAHHAGHHARRHYARHHGFRQARHLAPTSGWENGVAQIKTRGFAHTYASLGSSAAGRTAVAAGFGSSDVVSEARRYIGGNPTSRGSLWCARFMNMVLERSGHRGTGSDLARSFASYGQRVSGPQIGAIAVMGRRGGGHVGVVSGIDANGNPIVVSGNYHNRVVEAPYPRGRIYAYVMPTS